MLWHAAQKQRQLPPTGHSPVCFRVADAARVRSAGSLADLPTFSSHASSASISSDNSRSGNDSDPGAASNASTSAVGTAYPTSSNNPPSRQLYDTIIDTFGLCSHEDPVEVLRVRPRQALSKLNAQTNRMAQACHLSTQPCKFDCGFAGFPFCRKLPGRAKKTAESCYWSMDAARTIGSTGY